MEDQLADVLYDHRNDISNITGHTPFHILYGRHGRLPLTRLLRTTHATTFGNRLDNLAANLKTVRVLTEESRHYNRIRLEKKVNAKDISVGDSVVIKAEERISLSSRWRSALGSISCSWTSNFCSTRTNRERENSK